jgi:hypothetical protein
VIWGSVPQFKPERKKQNNKVEKITSIQANEKIYDKKQKQYRLQAREVMKLPA